MSDEKWILLDTDKVGCLSGRLLLVWYLQIVLELNDAIKVERTDKGRPYLVRAVGMLMETDEPKVSPKIEIDFSLSHDGDHVLLAVSHQKSARVGIDVTKIQSVDDARELEEALEDQVGLERVEVTLTVSFTLWKSLHCVCCLPPNVQSNWQSSGHSRKPIRKL